tara:strand:+ start:414 stop:752 length:339 start_codon:yes stop_codon:yes gene_type:complete
LANNLNRIAVQKDPSLLTQCADGLHGLQDTQLRTGPSNTDQPSRWLQQLLQFLQSNPTITAQRERYHLPTFKGQLISTAPDSGMLKGRDQQPTRLLSTTEPEKRKVVGLRTP